MTVLIVFVALLLVASGLVKARGAARVGLGMPVLPVVEVFAGLGILPWLLAGGPSAGQGMVVVVAGVLLVIFSSVRVGLAIRRIQRLRSVSEGARLANYVKYLSSDDPSPD